MRALAHGVTLALASLLLVTAPQAAAQAPAVGTEDVARRHHERGTMFYNLGQFEDAIAEYRKGYEQKADAVFLYNIAQAYRQIGAADKALFFYKRYLSTSPDARNRGQVEERIVELEASIAAGAKSAAPPEPIGPPESGRSSPSPLVTPPVTLAEHHDPARPLWKQWWAWAGAGAVVVAGVITAVAVASGGRSGPRTELGTERFF